MKKYLHHIKSKPTHERREHAMRVAGVVTALVFFGWISTLGVRLAIHSSAASVASAGDSTASGDSTSANQTQLAGVAAADQTTNTAQGGGDTDPNANHLEVATTSVFAQ